MPASAAPLLIAHRGASAQRPEHTLAAYTLAIEQGADFIEPDLVLTKDGVLVARHDVLLAEVELDAAGQPRRDSDGRPVLHERTTDVTDHPEFAGRLAVRDVDGEPTGGWFVDDFTLAELRTLRARERMPELRPANEAWADEPIPTFAEVLALRSKHDSVGVYPELKHPTYFATRGQDIVTAFLAELEAAGGVPPNRIFVQCFEIEPLLQLRSAAPELPRVQLLGALDSEHGSFSSPFDVRYHVGQGDDLTAIYGDFGARFDAATGYDLLATRPGLAWVSTYADGIGPWIRSFLASPEADPASVVRDLPDRAAHLGLAVHAYTLRPEPKYRLRAQDGTEVSFEDEVRLLVDLGVDGFFSDEVAGARAALEVAGAVPGLK